MKDDSSLPLKPPADLPRRRTLAPAWVAFLVAWLGVISLGMSIAIPFLPGSRNPQAELTHARPYSLADQVLPFVMYGQVVTLFLGIVVIRQMGTEPRPLGTELVNQRVQAGTGMVLTMIGVAFLYIYVGLRGPGRHL